MLHRAGSITCNVTGMVCSGYFTPVMQGRHICAQSESKRAACSPGVVPVGQCMCCLLFPSRRRRPGHCCPHKCIVTVLRERPHLGHSIVMSLWARHHASRIASGSSGPVTKSSFIGEHELGQGSISPQKNYQRALWSGFNTPVMQGMHIRAQIESEPSARPAPPASCWLCRACAFFHFILVAVDQVTAARTYVLLQCFVSDHTLAAPPYRPYRLQSHCSCSSGGKWWRVCNDDKMEWPRRGRSRSTVKVHVYGQR